MTRRAFAVVALCLFAVGCGGSKSPTAPSTPTTTTTTVPVTPTTYTIQGRVTSAAGPAISGATVRIVDGVNAGKSATTDGNGNYSIGSVTFAGFTVEASAAGFVTTGRGGVLTSGVTTATANFSLLPGTLWSQAGKGNQVFDMPTYVSRVQVHGVWDRTSNSNFIVQIGGRLVINEILRTSFVYDGTHLTNGGGVVQITDSNQITWTFIEVR